MKLFASLANHAGKDVKLGSNDGLFLTLKNGNKTVGAIAFEMWGQDTEEPFYALMWYPNGDLGAGEVLRQGTTQKDIKA